MEEINYNDYSDVDSVSSTEEKVEKLEKFKEVDYLSCQKTKNLLEIEHLNNFFNGAEHEINMLYEKKKVKCQGYGASILRFDNGEKIKGLIAGLVYKHINKKYNLEIFKTNPKLANPLIQKYNKKKNTRLL
ncbi:hypothetical protein OAI84_00555 [bacterium]|nr:hypothetical protein [bacterium]